MSEKGLNRHCEERERQSNPVLVFRCFWIASLRRSYRQYSTTLAMTSIAVTASICASASEAALLVATFISVSLDLGTSHHCPGRLDDAISFVLGTPHDEYSLLNNSPLSEYRLRQSRTVMRRQFDSLMLLLRRLPDTVLAPAPNKKSTISLGKPKVKNGPHRL